MHALFGACLLGGALATALFAVLGHIGGHGHVGSHAHVGGHGHVGGHALPHGGHGLSAHGHGGAGAHPTPAHGGHSASGHGHAPAHDASPSGNRAAQVSGGHGILSSSVGWTLSWLSPLSLAAAAAWFGGVGLLAERVAGWLAVALAVLGAVLGATLVRTVMSAFVRASTAPLQLTAEGAIGTVNATIRPGAAGEVIYTLEGLHRSVPARSEDGLTIPRGTAVVILRREGGFVWVSPLDPLTEMQSDVSLPPPATDGREDAVTPTSESEDVDASG